MRTNIDIDDDLMAQAMSAGPFKTKKDAVEAGLKLLARQAAYREILKWRGKLKWEGDDSIDWTQPANGAASATTSAGASATVQEPAARAYMGKRRAGR
jgi:Arc/MetJ family transcription regulator